MHVRDHDTDWEMVGAIAARLRSEGDFRVALEDTLRDIGHVVGPHRVLVARSPWNRKAIVSDVFQWQDDALAPWSLDDVQQRMWASPWCYEMIRSRKPVFITALADVPQSAASDRAHLVATNVDWLVSLPLCIGREILGALLCVRYSGEPREELTQERQRILNVIQGLLASLMFQAHVRSDLERRIAGERERLARDLHDTVIQSIYSLALFAKSARLAVEDGNTTKVVDDLEQITSNANRALRELRLLLHDLAPSRLDARGIAGAIEDRFNAVERHLGIRATLHVADDLTLPGPLGEVLYGALTEALSNVLRHAEASSVDVYLDRVDAEIHLQVTDDGRGFDPESATPGMGLTILRERVRQVEGHTDVESGPGQGTRIRVRVPTAQT